MFLTHAAGSVGIAISYESVFTLASIALHFRHKYDLRCPILCTCRVRAFTDRLIQLLFKQNSCRVSCCISHIYWKGPQDLDRKRRIVEIRGVGVEKGGIIVGAITAFWSCFIDVYDGVACEVHCIAKVEVSGRRE